MHEHDAGDPCVYCVPEGRLIWAKGVGIHIVEAHTHAGRERRRAEIVAGVGRQSGGESASRIRARRHGEGERRRPGIGERDAVAPAQMLAQRIGIVAVPERRENGLKI
jgi:hypothetical protein